MNVEKISAIAIKVNDMARSVHFYNRLLVLLCHKRRMQQKGQQGSRFSPSARAGQLDLRTQKIPPDFRPRGSSHSRRAA